MTFSPALEMLGHHCTVVKTDKKSQCIEKQEVSNYSWHTVC